MDAPKFEITKSIAILSTEKNGWTKELNLVSWNDRTPKYDLRSWSPDHQKMGKGVTLSNEEISALKAVLAKLA
ncbi:MAG: PC4/YdbC family ssDNA-binding protein [Oribacterium sp.]|nr:PC4/YdbC family ssDNA-binding protein [Oribacterium sp.]